MKGLIIKELFVVRSSMGVLLCLCILLHSYRLSLLALILLVVGVMQVAVIIFDDEKTGWDEYVNFLPLTYTEIILSKYIVGLICGGIIGLTIGGFNLIIKDMEDPLFIIVGGLLLGLFNLSLYVPLSIKFGYNYVGFIQFGLQIGIVYLLGKVELMESIIEMMLGNKLITLMVLLTLVAGITIVSIKSSAKIYENKFN